MGDGGTQWDAPNQQVVRDDASAPWEEGNGGDPDAPVQDREPEGLDAMTKDELLEHAQTLGVTPANKNMTKEELRAGIDQHIAEGG